MRHRNSGRKLGRTSSHREAMFRNMVTSLFEHERIVTTTPKAKEARRIADKMVTLAKRGDLHARRQVASYLRSKDVVAKLFGTIQQQFVDRNGGYTRIIQTGVRQGDCAAMAILELVGYQEKVVVPVES